jgi:hypothetical protein
MKDLAQSSRVLLDRFPEAREMRQVSAFSGVLSSKQRARTMRQFRKQVSGFRHIMASNMLIQDLAPGLI